MTSCGPIGVFDSGVGGLSVLREIRELLPHEDLVYIADSRYVPYGDKSADFIIRRSRVLGQWLREEGCKALVIACNTATVGAVAVLRGEWRDFPIIGMEPAVKPAVAASKKGVIGVLATVGTLRSAQFAALLDKFASDVRVVTQPAPGLVECVEAGELDGPATRALVKSFVDPLLAAGADVIVLGCTHYPFLAPVIQEMAGPGVTLVQTGRAVARHLKFRLESAGLPTPRTDPGGETFYTSGETAAANAVMDKLWAAGSLFREFTGE